MQPFICVAHPLAFAGFLTGSLLIAGCATTLPAGPSISLARSAPVTAVEPVAQERSPTLIQVARYGRYTLVELVPEPAQRDLLEQVVEISIPPALDANVGDGLRHVLLRTGYRLCETTETAVLYVLPLPAAHLHLGPLPLRDALLTLAGPAWDLSVDDAERNVCFRRATAMQSASTTPAELIQPRKVQP